MRPQTPQVDPLPALGQLAAAMAPRLAMGLEPLFGEGVEVSASPAEELEMAMLASGIGQLAGNSLIEAPHVAGNFLVSSDASAVLRLVDLSFGGSGELPEELPARFSLSAELAAARLDQAVLQALAGALALSDSAAFRPLRSHGDIALLAPFADECRLASFSFDVQRGDDPSWSVMLAFPLAMLGALLSGAGLADGAAGARPRPAPNAAPYADIPLSLRAVLVDMTMPLSAVSALEAGQVLPVAIARKVPLMAGPKTIARGTLGELDDRVALQISQLA